MGCVSSSSNQKIPAQHVADAKKLVQLFDRCYSADASSSVDIQVLGQHLGVGNNLWLQQFAHLCDRRAGRNVGFLEFVYVLGALGAKEHDTTQAEHTFVWRLLDLEDAGSLSRAEMIQRLKSVLTHTQGADELIFSIEQQLQGSTFSKAGLAVLYAAHPKVFAGAKELWHVMKVYSRGTISALGHVCKELGSEFLRPLQAYPMHLDVSTVEALIDMQMRVRKLNLEAKAMDNSEGMLQSVLNALKLRHSDMLGTLPSSIGNEIPSTPATETSPGNLLADSVKNFMKPVTEGRKKRLGVQGDTSRADVKEYPKNDSTRELIRRAIEDCMLFEALNDEVIDVLIGSMHPQTAQVGVEIIKQGDTEAEHFYVLEKGQIGVFVQNEDGTTQKVNTKVAGARFGELALLYSCPRNATVVVEKEGLLWVMDQKVYNTVNVTHMEEMEKRKAQLVDSVPIFQWLQKSMRQQLVDAMVPQEFRAGQIIMQKGEVGDVFYILDKGEVAVSDGDVQLVTLCAGASFGERALLADDKRTATVTALTPVSCLALKRKTIVSMLGPLEDIQRWCLLRKSPAMSFLSDEQLNILVSYLELQNLQENETLFEAGELAEAMFIVYSGEIKLIDDKAKQNTVRLRRGSSWRSTGELASLTKGDIVGEEALVFGGTAKRVLTAKSQNAPATVLRLEHEDIRQTIGSFDELQIAWRMNIVRNVPLLAPLSGYAQKKIVDAMEVDQYEDGALLAEEGDAEIRFHLIQFGTVVVSQKGNEVKRLRPGQYFGESSVLDTEPMHTYRSIGQSVVASVATEVMLQFGDTVKQLLAEGKASVGETTKFQLADLNSVKRLKLIGLGGFGQVFLVRIGTKTYAMKMLLKDHVLACKMGAQVNAERDIGMECDSPFMVNLYGTFRDSRYLYMFMEPVIGGELFSFVENHSTGNRGIDEKQARFFAACVILGLEYLHNLDIVYRDLKLENLLIDADGYIKIADFGFAKRIRGKTYTVCGTPEYMAPEIILRKGHGKGADIWALGALIFELVCRWTPFSRAGDDMAIMNQIKKGEFVCPSYMSAECKDLVQSMLQLNISERLGCLKGGLKDLKRHKWFAEIDWDKLAKKELKAPWQPVLKSDTDLSNLEPLNQSSLHPGIKSARIKRNSESLFDHW